MAHTREKISQEIAALFESQRLAVLSTHQDGQPYASLVAFDVSPGLGAIYLLTPDTTRKYKNLVANPRVSVLVNNSQNQADDIYNAVSVTGIGVAQVVDKAQEKAALDQFLEKHLYLKDFSAAATTAFVRIAMSRYVMVNRFQNVVELRISG